MNARYVTVLSGILGAGVLILCTSSVLPQAAKPAGDETGIFDRQNAIKGDDQAPQDGVQPLGRGPVHEAFAEPTTATPQLGPLAPKQPPEPIQEMPPADKPEGEEVQWISGYWSWDDESTGFLWVTGIWRTVPPGRQWVPGHWAEVKSGWRFVSGFWMEAGGDVKVVPAPPDPKPELEEPRAAVPTPAPVPGTTAPPPGSTTTESDSVFVPGTWVYEEQRPTPGITSADLNFYVWHPGYYVKPSPGWVYVPPHYVSTPCGYIFVSGYWDYPIQQRGLLFAPVVIESRYLQQPGWYYEPSYVVHDGCLLDALFVHGNSGCYFFGDYYDARYEKLDYVNWMDYRYGGRGFDPLFNYYRWYHRRDRGWEREQHGLFTARRKGEAVRPPRTLAAQLALARDLRSGKAVGGTGGQRSLLLASLTRVDRGTVKLQRLDKTGQTQHLKAAQQLQALSREHAQAESRLVKQGQTAARKDGPAQSLKLTLPPTASVTKARDIKTPPLPFAGRPRGERAPSIPAQVGPAGTNRPPPGVPGEKKVAPPPPVTKPTLPPAVAKPLTLVPTGGTKPPSLAPVETKLTAPPTGGPSPPGSPAPRTSTPPAVTLPKTPPPRFDPGAGRTPTFASRPRPDATRRK
jgi:hypothetical protein